MDPEVVLRWIAVAAPWPGVVLAALSRRHTRVVAFATCLISVLASAILLRGAPVRESLDEALMLLFSCLSLGATMVLPKRDCQPKTMAGMTSEGMLFDIGYADGLLPALVMPERPLPNGARAG